MRETIQLRSKLDNLSAINLAGKIMAATMFCILLLILIVLFLRHYAANWFGQRVGGTAHSSHAGFRRGLDPAVLKSYPVTVFCSEEFKEGFECPICLCEIAEGEKARMLPKCKHGFHVDCIDMWFQSHSTCPLCRNSVAPPPETPISNSTETAKFPTNVLIWGNQTQTSSGTSSSQNSTPDGMLVIDIPSQVAAEIFSPRSPVENRDVDGETNSPISTRMRSLKRFLSRDRRIVDSSPSFV